MKKSELKKYVRENIISELSESTEDEIAKTKELTQAVQDLESAKKEAGIEEKVANSSDDVIDPAEYGDIGKGYLSGFNKPHSLNDDDLETLGRKIVKQLYKGDFDKAKAKFIKEDLKDVQNVGLADIEEMGYNAGEDAFEKIKGRFRNRIDHLAYRKGFFQGFIDSASSYGLNENEDAEPTKSDIKKTKGLAKAKEELALLTQEMKSLAKKYSKAEGEEKEKLVKTLKDKTKLKKELESILDKKKI